MTYEHLRLLGDLLLDYERERQHRASRHRDGSCIDPRGAALSRAVHQVRAAVSRAQARAMREYGENPQPGGTRAW